MYICSMAASKMENSSQPLLYTDCEGFRGSGAGEFMKADEEEKKIPEHETHAQQEESAASSGQDGETSKMDTKETSTGVRRKIDAAVTHTLKSISRMLQPSMTKRSTAVDEMFPRLLYNFSDVIIYVVSHQAAKTMGLTLNKLVGWSDSSHEAAINRVVLPHFIIVINKCPKGSVWDQKLTTSSILKEQADLLAEDTAGTNRKTIDQLNKSYASVQFINIPNMEDTKPRVEQLEDFYSLIVTTVKAAQQNKADVGMSLPSRSLHQFYKTAFEHYSRTLDEPFNFIRALAEAQPPVKSLVNSFRTIMTAAMKALDVGR
ncbi:hypothetical protein LMH87_005601 [Akanthomyces muscarius]|uniref:Uncharacterized protein n=1 Tax=Akanthomyces muscarius TaxID=2231603 RepID=A0A9W8USA1_AKAMU|nr:hypothetical protein LMH87_005601 [Akanthomyces muscarius]KAJ4163899.1 hypothetical protein LMH87_005601 [Akanthomyces muscarius]